MEPTDAARFLNPSRFCLATVATTSALGELGSSAFPILFTLIATECNMPLSEAHSHSISFSALTNMFRYIPFKPKLQVIMRLKFPLQIAPESNLTEVLHAILYIAIATPYGITVLIDLLNNIFADAPSPASTFEPDGLIFMFLRKTYVAFHSLSFESEARLSHDLRQFIYPQPENVRYSSRAMHPATKIVANIALDLASGPPWILSSEYKTLAQDIRNCSSLLTPTSSLPSYMSQTMAVCPLPHTPDSAATVTATAGQYVAHLEALRRKDVSTIFDTLHRYFDRTLFFLPNIKPPSRSHSGATGNNDLGVSTTEPHAHQYAGLALATAHAQLGNLDTAVIALGDALRAAHASDDRVCRSRALAWIVHVEQEVPQRHLLLVHAANPLSLARDLLHTVFTPISDSSPHSSPPWISSAFTIYKIPGNINCTQIGPGDQGDTTTVSEPTLKPSTAERRMRSVLPTLTPYGKNQVQQLLLLVAIRFSDANAPTALASARLAAHIATAESPNRVTMPCVQATIAVAMLTTISEGQVEGAKRIMQRIRNEAVTASGTDIACAQESDSVEAATDATIGQRGFTAQPEIDALDCALLWLDFEQAERRGDVKAAELLCQQIKAKASVDGGAVNSGDDPQDLTLRALEANARLRVLQHDTWRAVEAVHILCRRAAVAVRPVRTIEALRLCAHAHLLVGAAGHALHTILAAISLGEGLGVLRARIQCAITFAECLLSEMDYDIEGNPKCESNNLMSASDRALRVIESVLPSAIEGLGVFERAHARRVHAECRLALLLAAYRNEKKITNSSSTTGNAKRRKRENTNEVRSEALKMNDGFDVAGANVCILSLNILKEILEAANDYNQCEDIEGEKKCWYLLARVYHWRGEIRKRNTAARKFNKLVTLLQYREIGFSRA